MKREELIAALNRIGPETRSLCCLGCGYEHRCSTHGCAIIRAAVKEIKALQVLPPNVPLTLEELREMDAPVWCNVDNCDWLPDGGYWCLCKKGTLITPALMQYNCEDLDRNLWRLYRREPKEGTP